MNEDFIHYLWAFRLLGNNLCTTNDEQIQIISTGSRNFDSGPDIFNALILIGNTKWAGNVEFHVNSSDWFKHNHNNNNSYDNIILHVVYKNDQQIVRKNGMQIPTVEFRHSYNPTVFNNYQNFMNTRTNIPCSTLLNKLVPFETIQWLDNLMVERLEKKSKEINNQLDNSRNNLLQIYYQNIAKGLGYTTNSQAMEILATSIPLKILRKHSNSLHQIESLLFGQSGLLNSNLKDEYPRSLFHEYRFLKEKYSLKPLKADIWRFMRMRPASFPTIRISQLSHIIFNTKGILNNTFELNSLSDIYYLLKSKASHYWNNHYRFDEEVLGKEKKLGITTINILLVNSIIPMMFVYGKSRNNHIYIDKALNWLSSIKPENNKITKEFTELGLTPINAMQSQSMIQLFNFYCIKKRCLHCRFGQILLNRD